MPESQSGRRRVDRCWRVGVLIKDGFEVGDGLVAEWEDKGEAVEEGLETD